MIPLDHVAKWSPILDECARQYLNESEYQEYQSIPHAERLRQVQLLLEKPIACFTPVNEVFFRTRWAEALNPVIARKELTLLEVASGDADMIPQMMARTYPNSRYITANTNRRLTHSLRAKTRNLSLGVQVIEADAAEIAQHLGEQSVDVVAFQHGVNDVIQAILCDQAGLDTIDTDWMEMLPKMIAILQREIAQNTLEQHAKGPFLGLLAQLLKVLKKDGLVIINHYMFQLDLDWGYPPVLWENIIPMTREWIKDLPGCKEVSFAGFDPQWWLFYQKL